jgi:class 3 adenylate cyclase
MHRNSIGLISPGIARAGIQLDMSSVFATIGPPAPAADIQDQKEVGLARRDGSQASSNGTRACAVLFLDIVAYSKRSISEQQSIKCALSDHLRLALYATPKEDLIVVDTGDGVAITFLNDIENAFLVAVKLCEHLSGNEPRRPIFEIRAGINLGPVKVITDINQHTNVIGDGINVAQRIMSFALPGQLLVSRSYYDMMKLLNSRYAHSFVALGRKHDKHAREHFVYEACPSGAKRSQHTRIYAHLRASAYNKMLGKWARMAVLTSVVVALSLIVVSRGDNTAQAHEPASSQRNIVDHGAAPDSATSVGTQNLPQGKAASRTELASPRKLSVAAPKQRAKMRQPFGRT